MGLGLTATDNQDGSGVLVTVTGSDGGSTNTVYASQPFQQGVNPPLWAAAGTRTGDGTLTVPLAAGYYFLFAGGTVGGLAAISPPVQTFASLAVLPVQAQVELAIQAKIQALNLAGLVTPPGTLPAPQVYRYGTLLKTMFGSAIQCPAVVVSPTPIGETNAHSMTGADDIGYPVTVTIVDRTQPQNAAPVSTYELWRQQIFRAIRNQRLDTASSVMTVTGSMHTAKYGSVMQWIPPDNEYMVSVLSFVAVSREPRGVGA